MVNRRCTITLIAAMSRNRVIGRDGALPWRMPADLRRFKERTMGHAVIMGRKTWQTLNGVALTGRTNIVVSRNANFHAPGAIVALQLALAIEIAQQERPEVNEVFIAGGAEIYRQALPLADRIDLTVIEVEIPDGDAFFPDFEHIAQWKLTREEKHSADARHAHPFAFTIYERVG